MLQYHKEAEKYQLKNDGRPEGQPLSEVAIAFDAKTGVLHKHGHIQYVSNWVAKTTASLRASGWDNLADDLVVIEGKFPVEELNKCLGISGYVADLYAAMRSKSRVIDTSAA